MRGPGTLLILSLAVAALVVLATDPEEPWAVALLILSLGVAAGAAAMLWQRRTPRGGARRRAPRPRVPRMVRRAAEVGAVTGLLLWLRAVDGLSLLTAAFVVAAFVVAEVVVSARPQSSR